MSKELIILVGNIGTGKSTCAKEFAQRGHIVISRDQFRYAIGGGDYIFDYGYEPIIWKTELYMFKKFIDLGVDIVVDEVGITKSMRKRYISYAKKHGYKIHAIIMPYLNKYEAVTRRMQNPHGQPDSELWEYVWEKFDTAYEPVTLNEGFNNITQL